MSLKEIAGKDPDVGQPTVKHRPTVAALSTRTISRARDNLFALHKSTHSSTYGNATRREPPRYQRDESNRLLLFLYNQHKNDSIALHKFAFTDLFL